MTIQCKMANKKQKTNITKINNTKIKFKNYI